MFMYALLFWADIQKAKEFVKKNQICFSQIINASYSGSSIYTYIVFIIHTWSQNEVASTEAVDTGRTV